MSTNYKKVEKQIWGIVMEKKDNNYYGIGKVLKKLRMKAHLTQEELALKLGFSVNTIKQYENNKREPRYDFLLKICDYFNVSQDFLKEYNFMDIRDVPKIHDSRLIPQHKKIKSEENFTTLRFFNIIEELIAQNTNSKHVLMVIKHLNCIIDSLQKIIINKKKFYMYYKKDFCDIIRHDYTYFKDNKLRDKPMSELEFYIYRENEFNEEMNKIQNTLREVFKSNVNEDYISYRKNFKNTVRELQKKYDITNK